MDEYGLDYSDMISVIFETGQNEVYLTQEKIEKFGFDSITIKYLIKDMGRKKVREYIESGKINEFPLDEDDLDELIRFSNDDSEDAFKRREEEMEFLKGIGFNEEEIDILFHT